MKSAILLAGLALATGARAQRIASFENAADQRLLQPHSARVSVVSEHATDGAHALRVLFEPGDWPNITFHPEQPWDWSKAGRLALDVTNPGKEPVAFHIRIDDDASADGVRHCRTGNGTITPGKTATFVMPLGAAADPMSYGMRGLPKPAGVNSMGSEGSATLQTAHIVQFQIFLAHASQETALIVDNLRVEPDTTATPLDGIVDRFGQYARAEWPGKLHAESELAQRRRSEEADLAAHPQLAGRDPLGGWTAGPTLKATGFFRTEKVNGRWWLVTPTGHLFFSLGVDCVQPGQETVITGRESMFTWLPTRDEPLGTFYGRFGGIHSGPVKEGTSYDFFRANLQRKYGADSVATWRQLALRRLPAWGFNTIANWSDHRLYRNGKVPYVATGGIGGKHARVSSGSDYWGQMHDPYDPRFVEDVANSLRPLAAECKGDATCLGYFVDNELSWGGFGDDGGRYGLAYGALSAPAGQPAKAAFVKLLRERYNDVNALNTAWGTGFASWDELNGPVKPAKLTGAAKKDMAAFVRAFATRYFTVIRDYLKREDPDHLYLGCRFAWRTPEAVLAAADVCDVVSFNIYASRLAPEGWLPSGATDKPCIIGEFHFGALDRGMFHTGLVSTASQTERATTYIGYVRSVADNPAFVGCHWFQYVDEPLTGRTYDGENYNIGFLNVTDTPYPEMVQAARQVHAEVYRRRFGKR